MAAARKRNAKSRKKPAVTADSVIGEVVMKYPFSAEIMMERGLHCIGCHISPFETIRQGAGGDQRGGCRGNALSNGSVKMHWSFGHILHSIAMSPPIA